ncbi:hypothetical protein [Kangiella sediminilitoris]|uniref:Uncharacterized protein n=1 Tax=Kangiella sediminilitoris TaxID=1144748 RepID=A0A1B3B8Q0_9GAMM|nr:hypothetical protein [Kangiella sediminilitoris]AOE49126.1 hypothetical protein KS2013_402 [Kangiella sediminilitoris]
MKQSIFFTGRLIALLFLFGLTAFKAYAESHKTTVQQVIITNGEVEGGTTLRFDQGGTVAVDIKSDQAMEIHLHGYDIKLSLEAGVPSRLAFDAKVAGRFSVTRHDTHGNDSHGALFYIEIYPQ